MPKEVTNMCKLFADDSSLQDDLDNFTKRSDRWKFSFNTSKCESLHIGKSNPKQQYTMNGYLLDNVDSKKDLGVIMDSELKFHIHASSAIKKANKILGLIKRTFANLDANTLPLFYKSMVRPHLEYGNTVWSPHFKLDQQAIEKV